MSQINRFESIAPTTKALAKEINVIVSWSDDSKWIRIENKGLIRVLDVPNIEIEYIHTSNEPEILIHSKTGATSVYSGDVAKVLFYILNKYLFSGITLSWNKSSPLFLYPQPHRKGDSI